MKLKLRSKNYGVYLILKSFFEKMNLMNYNQLSLDTRKNGSPLFTGISAKLENKDDLSTYYSPGIAEPCRVIAHDKKKSKKLD